MDEEYKTELTERKIEQLQNQPIVESRVWLSENEEWVVHETRIVDIKPVKYLKKVLGE